MTNYEKIIGSSVEKLAELINESDEYNYVANTLYCIETCPLRTKNGCSRLDDLEEDEGSCLKKSKIDCIIDWLNTEVNEENEVKNGEGT